MHPQIRRGAHYRNLATRSGKTQGPLDQQRASLVEAEFAQVYAHDAATCRTKGSTIPNRSTASSKAA